MRNFINNPGMREWSPVDDLSNPLVRREAQIIKLQFEGAVEFECPNCARMLHTKDAKASAQLEDGMRFLGVPCDRCGSFFTVEATVPRLTLSDVIEDVIEGFDTGTISPPLRFDR
jgi:hypothetical protein